MQIALRSCARGLLLTPRRPSSVGALSTLLNTARSTRADRDRLQQRTSNAMSSSSEQAAAQSAAP
jgi:hypothetical protein